MHGSYSPASAICQEKEKRQVMGLTRYQQTKQKTWPLLQPARRRCGLGSKISFKV